MPALKDCWWGRRGGFHSRQIWVEIYEIIWYMSWDMIWGMIYHEIWHNMKRQEDTKNGRFLAVFSSPRLRYVVLLYRTCIEDICTTQAMANPQQPNSELQRWKATSAPCSRSSWLHVNWVCDTRWYMICVWNPARREAMKIDKTIQMSTSLKFWDQVLYQIHCLEQLRQLIRYQRPWRVMPLQSWHISKVQNSMNSLLLKRLSAQLLMFTPFGPSTKVCASMRSAPTDKAAASTKRHGETAVRGSKGTSMSAR